MTKIPKSWEVFKDGYFYLIIIGVLLYFLLIAAMSPLRSALWATLAIPVIMLVDKRKRFTFKTNSVFHGEGRLQLLSVVLGCACAGIVVAMVALTGIGVVFGDMMIKASGGNTFLSLLYTHGLHHLGMGLRQLRRTSSGASILGPALTKSVFRCSTLTVYFLLCLPVGHHAACRTGRLCGCGHCQMQPHVYSHRSL
jgi:TRAP-type uncharacterized transport system fused permease subunit